MVRARRPTAPAHFWTDRPAILAGRDNQRNGTWLGVSTAGRFALLTNWREVRTRAGLLAAAWAAA